MAEPAALTAHSGYGRIVAFFVVRRGPVAPAVGFIERGREVTADDLGIFGFVLFLFVEDAQEQEPGEFRDVLQGAGAVGATQDVADRPDGGVDGLRGGQGAR